MRGLCVPFKSFRRSSEKKVWPRSTSRAKFLADELVDDFAIDGLPGQLAHHTFHHTPQVLRAAGTRLSNHSVDGRLNRRLIDGWGQVGFEQGNLGRLARRKLG